MKKSRRQKQLEDPNSRFWRNKCDKAWKEIIHRPHVCAICASTSNLQAHHLISRYVVCLRHNINNGLLTCPSCHKYSKRLSAHGASIMFTLWLQKNRPEQFAWVVEHANDDFPVNFKQVYEGLIGS